MGKFDYLSEKIRNADFSEEPFKHIYIENFFEPEHFEELISCREISVPEAKSDRELIDGLYEKGFKVIPFPGCIENQDKYISWHESGKKRAGSHTAVEGFGMTLRLFDPQTPILQEISEFLAGDDFTQTVAKKFGLDPSDCTYDGGIQKYLDGYEISPHPDIRRKAATFMVNINPSPKSEASDHHTHYLKLRPERTYVKSFWEGNPKIDRAWVPWDWTETVYQQTKNNSIVLFSPSNDTMHGVKADYDHLVTQRTQLYGNLWYKANPSGEKLEWEDLDLTARGGMSRISLKATVKSLVPQSFVKAVRDRQRKKQGVGNRAPH